LFYTLTQRKLFLKCEVNKKPLVSAHQSHTDNEAINLCKHHPNDPFQQRTWQPTASVGVQWPGVPTSEGRQQRLLQPVTIVPPRAINYMYSASAMRTPPGCRDRRRRTLKTELLCVVLCWTATAAVRMSAAGAAAPPGFSWETLPVHWFSANATSQLSAAMATQIASRHSLAIINGQSHAYWATPAEVSEAHARTLTRS
jgi:hypothetical protein